MEITFVTGNPEKAKQLSRYLDYPIRHQKLDLSEIQSLDLEEIVTCKVKEAFKIIKKPALVEDISLKFAVLGNLPGPFIKWFLKELDNPGLCRLVDGYQSRDALVEVNYAFYDGTELKIFSGSLKGTIAKKPRGEGGFGWNSVFIPDGYEKTLAEMTPEEQEETSFRKIALTKLHSYLNGKTA